MKNFFPRELRALNQLFNFLDAFVKKHRLDASAAYAINLVVEELFVNMVKYQSDNPNPVSVSLRKEENRVVVVLIDFNVDPFDITQTGDFDPTQPLEKRQAGGMGIHLVKTVMDDIQYDYNALERTSKIQLIKNI